MINKVILISILILLISCRASKNNNEFHKIEVDTTLYHKLFDTINFMLDPLALKTETGIDNIENGKQMEITSTCLVNNDSLRLMRFTDLKQVANDTLKLSIFELNPLYYNNLDILIVGNQFKMQFNFDQSGPIIERKIKPIHQQLILSTLPSADTRFILGKLYFKATCKPNCDDVEITGYFKSKR